MVCSMGIEHSQNRGPTITLDFGNLDECSRLRLVVNKFFSPFPSENGSLVNLGNFYSPCCMLR
jgi:hypothetical protein